MDNNAYSQPSCKPCPYIINVKEFRSAILCLPLEGTVANRLPYSGSDAAYTFPVPFSTDRYPITQLVFCDKLYWVKIPNLGSNANITGYVKCSDISFDYEKYVDPDQQTPNSQIGTNTDVIFNMWYFPNNKYKGVDYATPLYYQFYNGRTDSGKCTLLSSISGLYKYKGIYLDPTDYLKEMTAQYWMAGVGVHTWPTTMKTTGTKDEIRKIAKKNLSKQMPILVGAGNDTTPHMVLVVGYKNCGVNLSDYLVLDSAKQNFSTLEKFFEEYPNYTQSWGEYLGKGYVYGEYSEYQN